MASKGEARAKKIPWHGPTVGKGEGCGEREGSHELTANCSACGKRKKERARERGGAHAQTWVQWAALISIMHCRTLTGLLRNGVIDRE